MKIETSLGRALAGSGTVVDFSGIWKNELQSQMTIRQTNDQVTGIYESAVSGGHATTTGDLVGYADGDMLSFVVHWRDFQAITAWVGQLDPAGGTLNTLWQMVKQVNIGDEWSSINAGADQFIRA
jgi:hypothetical protein